MGPKRARQGVASTTRQGAGRGESSSRRQRSTGRGESSSQPAAQPPPTQARQQPEDFDRQRFVSAEAHSWYGTSFTTRNIVMERAIKFTAPDYEHFEDELERRQWLSLAANLTPAHTRLVEEFYANLRYTLGSRIFLRGQRIDFSPAAINSLYQAPEVDNDAFTRMLDGEVNWEEVLETIGHPGSHWTYHAQPSTKPRHLENRFLNRDARVWLQVILSRLRPVTHTHSITPDRCILLHCLVTGQDIDLGKAIWRHMQHVANSTAALAFPCTITTMALQAGVQVDDDEAIAYPEDPLTNAVLHYVFRRAPPPPQIPAAEVPQQEAEAPPSPPPEPEPAPAAAAAPPQQNMQPFFHEFRMLRQELRQIELAQNRDRNRNNRQFWALSRQLTSVATDMRTLEDIMRMQAPPDLLPQLPRLPPMPPADDDEEMEPQDPEDEDSD